VVCGNLPQLADFVRLATPLARFGKVDRTATNQKVGSSNPPGRTISLNKTQAICAATGAGYVSARLRGHLWVTCGREKEMPKKSSFSHSCGKVYQYEALCRPISQVQCIRVPAFRLHASDIIR
jgi:hypothetical protein